MKLKALTIRLLPWVAVLTSSTMLGCSGGGRAAPSASTGSSTQAAQPPGTTSHAHATPSPAEVPRTTPAEAQRKVQAGEALLVCAYPDAGKYEKNKLAGSISLQELEHR